MTASHSGHLDTSIAPPHCIQIRDNKPRRSAIPFLHHSFHSFQDTRSKFEPLCVRAKLDHFLSKREMCLYLTRDSYRSSRPTGIPCGETVFVVPRTSALPLLAARSKDNGRSHGRFEQRVHIRETLDIEDMNLDEPTSTWNIVV